MKIYGAIHYLELEMDGKGETTAEDIAANLQTIRAVERVDATATGRDYRLECGHTVRTFGAKAWSRDRMLCLECIEAAEMRRLDGLTLKHAAGGAL